MHAHISFIEVDLQGLQRKVKIMKLKRRIDILKVHTGMKSGKEKTVKKWKGGELVFQLWLLTTSQLIALIEPRCQELLHHWKIPINRTNIEILQTSISSPILDLRNKSNNIYVLYISCTGKQEMRINLRQKRIKWCLLWPAQNGGIFSWAGHIFRGTQNYIKNFSEIFHT